MTNPSAERSANEIPGDARGAESAPWLETATTKIVRPPATHNLVRPRPCTVPDDACVGAPRKLLPLIAAVILSAVSSGASAGRSPQTFADSFVTRSGVRLAVAGRPFRFGGANVEWLRVGRLRPSQPARAHSPS